MFENMKAVVVDDNEINIIIMKEVLKNIVGNVYDFENSKEAKEFLIKEKYDIVFLDYMMPDIDGLELIEIIRFYKPDIPILMVTAYNYYDIKIEALKKGVTDFLIKPIDKIEFEVRVKNILKLREKEILLKNRSKLLEYEVKEEIVKSNIRELETLEIIGKISVMRDSETGNHLIRVGEYSRIIAKYLRKSEKFQYIIRYAAPLHDIGKIGIDDSILKKNGKLSDEEYEIMKKHTIIGYEFLKNLKSQFLRTGALISLSHHERYDGSGYPYGIKGKEINIFARIVSVADVFDALVSERIYKDAWTLEEAFEEIKESSGKQFDPECVKAFSEGFSEIKEIFYKYNQEGVNNGRYL